MHGPQVNVSEIGPWVSTVVPMLLSMLEIGVSGWRRQVSETRYTYCNYFFLYLL